MEELTADSVIMTTPLHIICEMAFEPTNTFIQSKIRFWETDHEGIVGGFTKATCQLVSYTT